MVNDSAGPERETEFPSSLVTVPSEVLVGLDPLAVSVLTEGPSVRPVAVCPEITEEEDCWPGFEVDVAPPSALV